MQADTQQNGENNHGLTTAAVIETAADSLCSLDGNEDNNDYYEEDEYDYPYDYDSEEDDVEEETTALKSVSARLQKDRREWFLRRSSSLPIVEKPICKHCRRESHVPIQDCKQAAQWLERVDFDSSGILTVDPRHVVKSIYKRAAGFAKQNPKLLQDQEAAIAWLRLHHWNEAADEGGSRGNPIQVIATETMSFLLSTVMNGPGRKVSRSLERSPQKDNLISCGICYDDALSISDVMSMKCGHTFCRHCWHTYLATKLQENRANANNTTCPGPDCGELIGIVQVRDVAPEQVKNFEQNLLNSFVHGRPNDARCCPGPDCNHVAVKSSKRDEHESNDDVVVCRSCRTHFAFSSGIVREQTQQTPGEQPDPFLNLRKYIRKCPSCRAPIEKNGGCNRMHCKCGHQFCWLCLKDFNIFTGHTCDRPRRQSGEDTEQTDPAVARRRALKPFCLEYIFDEEDHDNMNDPGVQQMIQTVQDLDRFRQFEHRYTAHHHGQCFAENQCECLERRQADFSRTNRQDLKTGTDADFLMHANERLVACRRVLKYSHAFLYHFAAKNGKDEGPEITLFRTRQEQLGRFTEELSGLSENALSYLDRSKVLNLIGAVDKSLKTLTDAQLTPLPW